MGTRARPPGGKQTGTTSPVPLRYAEHENKLEEKLGGKFQRRAFNMAGVLDMAGALILVYIHSDSKDSN